MKPLEVQIPLFEGLGELRRKEARESLTRQVEYCRFPRVCADQRTRLGHTRDLSESGLCLQADSTEPIGSLLRFSVRGLDGMPAREGIGRVAWSRPDGRGGHLLGLAVVTSEPSRPLRLRYVRRSSDAVAAA